MNALNNILFNIDRPFYFGVGGIGDFLLLMSTFYDDVSKDAVDVIFVCNNIKPLQWLTSNPQQLGNTRPAPFRNINRFWFLPRKAVHLDQATWELISNDVRFRGSGVTPKHFDYWVDWNKCGESNVFDYYGVNKNPTWGDPWKMRTSYKTIIIQPFGGADDPTKIKQMSIKLLHDLVDVQFSECDIVFIGSESDMVKLRNENWSTTRSSSALIRYCTDIKEAINYIQICDKFYGTDSWGKTMAAFAGKREIFVFKNRYVNNTTQQMFGQDVDPGDHVFLDNWGFKLCDDPGDIDD